VFSHIKEGIFAEGVEEELWTYEAREKGTGEGYTTRIFMFSPNTTRVIKSRIIRWAGMEHVWGPGEVHTWF
jgi:hypothetical protein